MNYTDRCALCNSMMPRTNTKYCSSKCRVEHHKIKQQSDYYKNERGKTYKKKRFEILKRDNFRCLYCGVSPIVNQEIWLEIDHIEPKSITHKDLLDESSEKLVTSCNLCNKGKSNIQLDKDIVDRLIEYLNLKQTLKSEVKTWINEAKNNQSQDISNLLIRAEQRYKELE